MRAFNAEQILQDEFERHYDLNTGVWFMFLGTSNGFGILLDLMVYIFTGCVIYFFLVVNEGVCLLKVPLFLLELVMDSSFMFYRCKWRQSGHSNNASAQFDWCAANLSETKKVSATNQSKSRICCKL